MRKTMCQLIALATLAMCNIANSGVVIESTRYLYKEGNREISAQMENKDDSPFLMKSWIEAADGENNSYFMVTPPLFRLEAKQKNTVRIFPNAYISKAPKDRDSVYFFNVMSIPPTDNSIESDNKLQLAVRHRMRLIYRPKAIQNLNIDTEANKLEWRKTQNKLAVKNPTPFFIYFKSVLINGKELKETVAHIDPFTTKEVALPTGTDGHQITWKVATENGGSGSTHTSSL
ncbi:molecular chaperone [Leclercia adecarboxylata]|uniref:fimbrial biogenesis chaperone n=1 Tax=Leclercia adecarboxylata TaxID=83655 RepID=UPI002DBE9EF4|nr:molecular chaperone [Leclercia adecarboxylata]MEB6379561.1 molecular chaperone [Leclercia adecarboxylata]